MSVIVVFYSRYSQPSLNFLTEIEKIMDIRKLCVDNENVREKILEEKENYSIECVPSVLIFHSNGFLEKQAGNQCFEWLEKVKPQQVEEVQMEEVKPLQEKNEEKIQQKEKMERISVEDIKYETSRKIDTVPLVLKEEKTDKNDVDEKIKEDRQNQAQSNIKKSSDQGNIMSVAQQMQKERELEVKD
jgi:hypothetical protein